MSATVSWNEHGFLRGVRYHDGHLEGIVTDDASKQVQLAIRATTGERRVLTLRRVTMLHVDGFREDNIVLNIRTLPATRVADDAELRRRVAARLSVDVASLPADAVIFLLESSFGAEVLAACSEVDVSELEAKLVLSHG